MNNIWFKGYLYDLDRQFSTENGLANHIDIAYNIYDRDYDVDNGINKIKIPTHEIMGFKDELIRLSKELKIENFTMTIKFENFTRFIYHSNDL